MCPCLSRLFKLAILALWYSESGKNEECGFSQVGVSRSERASMPDLVRTYISAAVNKALEIKPDFFAFGPRKLVPHS